jgi:hypothetical protein
MRRHFLSYLTFATIGFSQPLLDLYGRNITVFSAASLSRAEVWLFILSVLLVPALLATGVDVACRRRGPRVNDRVRLVLLGVLSLAIGLAAARWLGIDHGPAVLMVATGAATALPFVFHRSRGFRLWTRWASLLAVIVGGTALVQVRPALIAAEGDVTDAVVGRDGTSVLLVLLDEVPFYGMLDSDGAINAERFPGFARLAAESTWYRDTIATSNFTHEAVPAILASASADGSSRPFLYDHPRNIFTLFDGVMDVAGIEPVTNLCPPDLCGGGDSAGTGFSWNRFRGFLEDAGLVYLHRTMPSFVRDHLPSIDGAWGGFGGVADDLLDALEEGPLAQSDAVATAVRNVAVSTRPVVQVVHAMLPHYPWVLSPDERLMDRSPDISLSNPDDEDGVRDNYQAALYQLAAADAAVARAIEELKRAGQWDDTLVIVTADHGISFVAGEEQRETRFEDRSRDDDIYRVPLFVKYPGSRAGATSDCPATSLDVLPTIVDVLDVETSWTFDGASLAGECPARPTRIARSISGQSVGFTGGFADLRARSDHYDRLVPRDGPAPRIAAVGEAGVLFGTRVPRDVTDAGGITWTLDQWPRFGDLTPVRGSRVPAVVTGGLVAETGFPEGTEGVLTADGVVVGVMGEIPARPGRTRYTAILDYSRLVGTESVRVELYLRFSDGGLLRVPFGN